MSRTVILRTAILACALVVVSAAVWTGASALNMRAESRDAVRRDVAGASGVPARARRPAETRGPGDADTEELRRRSEELRRRLAEMRKRADEMPVRLREGSFRSRSPGSGCLIGSSRFDVPGLRFEGIDIDIDIEDIAK